MRVWIVHHYALDPSQAGGTRHHALAAALTRAGHEVLVIAAGRHYQDGTDPYRYDASGESRAEVDGIGFLRVRTAPFAGNSARRVINMASFGWRVLRSRWLRERPAPTVVVGSSPQPLAAWAALRLARRTGARFVYEIRDLWPETLVAAGALGRWHPLVLLFGAIEGRCIRQAAAIVTLLPAAGEYLVQHGADPARITWVPNGSDLDPAPAQPAGHPFRFVYAGAIGHANGLDILIDAAHRLEQRLGPERFEVRIFGAGRERGALEARVGSLGVRSVRFEGAVPKRDVGPRLGEADVLVMILRDSPVFRFGVSPNKLFDYLAVGRPVLFAVRAANDPVSEAGAGVWAEPTPDAVAAAMDRLMAAGDAERRAMGERGRAYQQRHHRTDQITERFLSVISGAAASSPS